jgi:peroxiredoxin
MDGVMTKTATLKIGDEAPDFTLEDQDRKPVTLSSFRGQKNVVLIFHPLAFTSICAIQMPGYSKEKQTFEGFDAQVLGVSVDSTAAHRAWARELGGIDYPMLADFWPHGEVAKRYGILRPDGTSERASFILDKKGIIRWLEVHEKSKVPDMNQLFQILKTLKS